MDKRKASIMCSVITILILAAIPVNPYAMKTQDDPTGPYLDKIRYDVITDENNAIEALGDGSIDMIGELLDSSYLAELKDMANVAAEETLDNGYTSVIVNCHRYPLNLTAFRRALSFAVDKYAIRDDLLDGLGVPLDGCVPKVNPFSIENKLSTHYYDADVQKGKDILAAAGFDDYDDDGLLEAPNQSDFTVLFKADDSIPITVELGQMFVDTLHALDIDAEIDLNDGSRTYLEYMFYGEFDLIYLGHHFGDFDVDWLAWYYWSEFADDEFASFNYARFENASYDSWRGQLLNGTEYDDVYEAALKMQEIWVYQCPEIVCYEYIKASAYRTDRFEGFQNEASCGIPGFWTNYQVHLKDSEGGPEGGTLKWSNPSSIDTFNYLDSQFPSSKIVLNMLYDPLIRRHWNGEDIMWLAKEYTVITHDDNSVVPEGHMRFDIEIINNATWSDGEPLDADDIVFSLDYYKSLPDYPFDHEFDKMVKAEKIHSHRFFVEFETESFWHLHEFCYKPILPQHVFESISPSNWDDWDPNPPDEEMVTSGPFNVSSYVADDFCELSRNPNYFYASSQPITTTSSTATTTGNTTNGGLLPFDSFTLVITIGAAAAVILIIIVIVKYNRT